MPNSQRSGGNKTLERNSRKDFKMNTRNSNEENKIQRQHFRDYRKIRNNYVSLPRPAYLRNKGGHQKRQVAETATPPGSQSFPRGWNRWAPPLSQNTVKSTSSKSSKTYTIDSPRVCLRIKDFKNTFNNVEKKLEFGWLSYKRLSVKAKTAPAVATGKL